MRPLQNRCIYRDDFDLLHNGAKRLANRFAWQIVERPAEGEETPPNLVTLEDIGLGRLRPIVEEEPTAVSEVLKADGDEGLICETCVNRHNPPGSGPCGKCDLTVDGEASEYRPEPTEEETLDEPEETLDETETDGPDTLEGT